MIRSPAIPGLYSTEVCGQWNCSPLMWGTMTISRKGLTGHRSLRRPIAESIFLTRGGTAGAGQHTSPIQLEVFFDFPGDVIAWYRSGSEVGKAAPCSSTDQKSGTPMRSLYDKVMVTVKSTTGYPNALWCSGKAWHPTDRSRTPKATVRQFPREERRTASCEDAVEGIFLLPPSQHSMTARSLACLPHRTR
ncbi:hypothetical protein BD413DRAFT_15389 [Trametes elegans]|nr:hypothetical protein BD413DRAFT_15389 [Trametes elegans]